VRVFIRTPSGRQRFIIVLAHFNAITHELITITNDALHYCGWALRSVCALLESRQSLYLSPPFFDNARFRTRDALWSWRKRKSLNIELCFRHPIRLISLWIRV